MQAFFILVIFFEQAALKVVSIISEQNRIYLSLYMVYCLQIQFQFFLCPYSDRRGIWISP